MRIIRSDYSGFCAGIKRAVDALNSAKISQPFTPLLSNMLLHNSYEQDKLSVEIFQKNIKYPAPYFILIAAHGCTNDFRKFLKDNQIPFADATCPVVQSNIDKAISYDGEIIYIAQPEHSEVKNFMSYVDCAKTLIIDSSAALEINKDKIKAMKKPLVIVQTTFSSAEYSNILSVLLSLIEDIEVFRSICPDCLKRRKEVIKFAKTCDCSIIVGDTLSSNAKELYSISKSINPDSYLILNKNDPVLKTIKSNSLYDKIGVISSASSSFETYQEIIGFLYE